MDFEYVKQKFNALDEKLQGLIELNSRLILENIKLNNKIQQFASTDGVQASFDTDLRSAVRPNKVYVQEAIHSEQRIAQLTHTDANKPKILEILSHNDHSLKVIGNTYLHRTILKENGGSWDKNVGGWIFSDASLSLDKLAEALTEKGVEFKNNFQNSLPTQMEFVED